MIRGFILRLLSVVVALGCFGQEGLCQTREARVTVKFENMASNKLVVLHDSTYVNDFAEQYSITKLKYYISDIYLGTKEKSVAAKNIFLIDAAAENEISIPVVPGIYSTILFTLGIDSSYNYSGAQDGALDPLNGMFWTWNTGYIYFKLEGNSDASSADLHRIEHHIGGYQGASKANRQIQLNLNESLIINKGENKEIIINLNLDKYWKGVNDISIFSNSLIMTTGELAKKSADNFPGMFSIKSTK